MSKAPYAPPKVWKHEAPSGGHFASINRPIAGPTHDKTLPVGKHPLQLYSLATPNGVKTILLEELLLGHSEAEYDAWLIRINEGDQFSSGFVEINPNSKIPALLDRSAQPPIRVVRFDPAVSGGKIRRLPAERPAGRTKPGRWALRLIWAAASGTSMRMRRRSSNTRSTASPWKPSVSSMYSTDASRKAATWPATATPSPTSRSGRGTANWCATTYSAAEFLAAHEYTHVQRWAEDIAQRPAVKRGQRVNRTWGDEASQVAERHQASDLD
jgi:GST-like protein